MNQPEGDYPIEIDVQSVQAMLDGDEDFLLVDCREPSEYQLVHIKGSKHIPMQELPTCISELDAYRDRRIVVHCHHGGRSLQVVHWLRERGFENSQNMTGGIDVWSVQIDPSLPRY